MDRAQTLWDRGMGRLAEGAAHRDARMAPLQGMFGGNVYTPPPSIQSLQPQFMQQQAAFNDLSRYLMQRQNQYRDF
jgi:hypothetical protein